MTTEWTRGSLAPATDAPTDGETFTPLAQLRGVRVEQILSGPSASGDFDQAHDEWVVLLAGGAEMLVAGERVVLAPGDWLLLPARTPHAVLSTEAGTSWVAVHWNE